MKKIAVLTTTRAEYGLLRTLILRLQKEKDAEVSVLVSGMHLSEEYGLTFQYIEKDGLKIDARIPILQDEDSPAAVSKTMATALSGFADFFAEHRYDCLIVLGDRYETLAVVCAAFNENIPVFHIHGGEITEGALDDGYRHAITKLSYLHFTSTESYRKRVIQLGESPDRVFHTGALGVENAKNLKLPELPSLYRKIGRTLKDPFAVVTFHPVTTEAGAEKEQCHALIEAMKERDDIMYLCTKANSDAGGRMINQMLQEFAEKTEHVILVPSLGIENYLLAVKHSAFVLGNSSSGLLEVPSFGVPTVNIGDRQKGRIAAESVISCSCTKEDILAAIEKAMSEEFRTVAKQVKNPYEGKDPSGVMTERILSVLSDTADFRKHFYDINF